MTFLVAAAALPASAAPITDVLAGGIAINEILIDPTGPTSIDADEDGTAVNDDEYIEIVNISATAIDISNFQIWDSTFGGELYAFPGAPGSGTTMLEPFSVAVVFISVQSGGMLPAVTGDNLAFDAGLATFMGFGRLDNDGENIALYDPNADEHIQMLHSSNPPFDFLNDLDSGSGNPLGFPSSSTLVGSIEDWGAYVDGCSRGHSPDDETTLVDFCNDGGVTPLFTPGAVNNPSFLPPVNAVQTKVWTLLE